jgi:DNA-binding NarL/FixJ family response regulator
MATILIVDDSSSIREFLKINLASERDIQIIGVADNGQAAIALVREHQPNLVLMDIEMPGIDGIQTTEIIVKSFPNTKVLLLTSQDDRQQLNLALKAGARGYILKNTGVKDIASIIRLTEKGFFQIGPILGTWDGSQNKNLQSDTTHLITTTSSPTKVGAMVQQNGKHANETGDALAMNNVLSNLTSGIFQLQETIKAQENTIVNLTNQYSQVQQEIRTKLKKEKRVFNGAKAFNYYGGRSASSRFSQRRQHILFIVSFLLGAFTVLFLLFLIMLLGAAS